MGGTTLLCLHLFVSLSQRDKETERQRMYQTLFIKGCDGCFVLKNKSLCLICETSGYFYGHESYRDKDIIICMSCRLNASHFTPQDGYCSECILHGFEDEDANGRCLFHMDSNENAPRYPMLENPYLKGKSLSHFMCFFCAKALTPSNRYYRAVSIIHGSSKSK